jgi:hypothetical protein
LIWAVSEHRRPVRQADQRDVMAIAITSAIAPRGRCDARVGASLADEERKFDGLSRTRAQHFGGSAFLNNERLRPGPRPAPALSTALVERAFAVACLRGRGLSGDATTSADQKAIRMVGPCANIGPLQRGVKAGLTETY